MATNTYKSVKHVGIIAIFCILLLLSSTICDPLPLVPCHTHAQCIMQTDGSSYYVLYMYYYELNRFHMWPSCLFPCSVSSLLEGKQLWWWILGGRRPLYCLYPYSLHTHTVCACLMLCSPRPTYTCMYFVVHYVHVCIYMYSYRCILCR